jgi:hypothetical protein
MLIDQRRVCGLALDILDPRLLCTAFSLREYYLVFKRTAWEQSVIPTYLSTNAPEMQSIPDGFQAWHEGRETFTGAGQPDQA